MRLSRLSSHPLGDHASHLFIRQGEVAFVLPAVGIVVERVLRQVNGALAAGGAGNFNDQQRLARHVPFLNIGVADEVDADLLAVVQIVEQLGTYLGHIFDAHGFEPSLPFAHAQKHQSAVGVGHGTVGRPEIIW